MCYVCRNYNCRVINYISQLYFLHVWSHLTLRDQKSWSILYILVIFPVRNVDILLLVMRYCRIISTK